MAEAKKTTPTPIPAHYESNPFNLITASIEAYKVNVRGLVFALITAILGLIAVIILGVIVGVAVFAGGQMAVPGAGLLLGLVAVLLGFILLSLYLQNYLLVIMLAAAQGKRLEIGPASKQAFKLIPKIFAIGVLTFLAVLGGFLLFIIPGFIFMGWFALSAQAAIHENLGPIAAMKRSRELVRDHLIETWGLLGLQSSILGIVMLASMPVRYLQLIQLKAGKLQKPELHWANYLGIIIGMLSGITLNVPSQEPKPQPYTPPPTVERTIESGQPL